MILSCQLFSAKKFLFARPENHQLVTQLVDTFNNIVQYQHEGNTQLVYSIVLRKHCIEQVRNRHAAAILVCVMDALNV